MTQYVCYCIQAPSEQVGSPASQSSTVHRQSVGDDIMTTDSTPKDDVTVNASESLTRRTGESELSLSSEEEMEIDPLLSPDPLDDSTEDGRDSVLPLTHTHTPLFLHVEFTVQSKTTEKVYRLTKSHDGREGSRHSLKGSCDTFELPLCMSKFAYG